MNFTTKDYCKCLVEPVFMIPKYGKLTKFQKEYMSKECFREEFTLQMHSLSKGEVLTCLKKSSSSFDKLRTMVLKVADKEEGLLKKQQT